MSSSVSAKQTLSKAKKTKQDEFYTQLEDISNELRNYRTQLKGRIIFCNCDDPFESNFFKYFALNFNTLGLKKLVVASYRQSSIVGDGLHPFEIKGLKPKGKAPYVIEIQEVPDQNKDGAIDLTDVKYLLTHNANVARTLTGDGIYSAGDFRSRECIEYLQQADVVITNPPFSLFREYMSQLVNYNKKFLIIGHQNAITYKEVFKLIKENKIWIGVDNGGTKWFRVPHKYDIQTESRKKIIDGLQYFSMGSIVWFTNMDNRKRHEDIPLYRTYSPDRYQRYDNYDAIEVAKVAEIPDQYDGAMGVPITFLDKYNPGQFEILGWTRGADEFDAIPTKRYVGAEQHKDGTISNGGKVNTGPNILYTKKPGGTYYVSKNTKGYLVQLYMRILIKRQR